MLAVTPAGRFAIAASIYIPATDLEPGYDKPRVWDLKTGRFVRSLKGHSGAVTGIAISPQGRLVISSSADKTLRVCNFVSGDLIASFRSESDVHCCAVAPDGVTIIAGDTSGRVHFLRLEI